MMKNSGSYDGKFGVTMENWGWSHPKIGSNYNKKLRVIKEKEYSGKYKNQYTLQPKDNNKTEYIVKKWIIQIKRKEWK